MQDYILAFALGNAAILTNACLLPLYPGLIAFLAGNQSGEQKWWTNLTLGALVLGGILSMMLLIGFVLALLSAGFTSVLPILLPIVYAAVIALGIAMLLDRNPFATLQTIEAPMLSNRYATAYVYGLLFGPMTLPCTGPLVVSAFTLGTDVASLLDGIVYFLFFGLGFGWPLLLLPLFALPLQRNLVSWLSRHHTVLNRASGVLLVAIGLFGILTELIPQLVVSFEFGLPLQLTYWLVTLLVAVGVAYLSMPPKQKNVTA